MFPAYVEPPSRREVVRERLDSLVALRDYPPPSPEAEETFPPDPDQEPR